MMSALFSPLALGGTRFSNRIVVAPMCQYSAPNGAASDWHLQHVGQYAISGAGLVIVEATAVEAAGRITPLCLSLYTDAQESALARVLEVCRSVGDARIGIQLAHAGRKASCHPPWIDGGSPLRAGEGAWDPVGPSAIPYDGTHPVVPQALDDAGLARICRAFADATRRAARIGFDVVELHAAHGYLLHSFLSPLANVRTDAYGGSASKRMRFPLEVAAAVRDAWPAQRCLGARVNACDFLDGGGTPEDAIAFARALKSLGYNYICVSRGSLVGGQKFDPVPGYMLPYAARLRAEVGIATQAPGMIVDPALAESAVASGQIDMVAMARAFLDDPRWVWRAAEQLGVAIDYPAQYVPAHPRFWPAAKPRERAVS
jgi:NADPH2 dehydrogenase